MSDNLEGFNDLPPAGHNPGNDWTKWSKHVLLELQRLSLVTESLREDIADFRTELATLKVKAGLWGAAGAAIPVVALVLMQRIK